MLKSKVSWRVTLLVLLAGITACINNNSGLTIGDIFSSFYFNIVVIVIYILFFRDSKENLHLLLIRMTTIKHFFLYRTLETAKAVLVDNCILFISSGIIVYLLTGSIVIQHVVIYFLAYYLLLLFYNFFLLSSLIIFRTPLVAFGTMFILFFYSVLNLAANPYLNPYATILSKFWIYKQFEEPVYYTKEGGIAFLFSLGVWVSFLLTAINWKMRRIEL